MRVMENEKQTEKISELKMKPIEKTIIDEAFSLLFIELEKERVRLRKHIKLNHTGNILTGKRDYKRELEINQHRVKRAIKLKHKLTRNEKVK